VLARGPGETKLETDRRRILQRVSKLERELKETVRHRETQRKSRRRSEIPQVSIVGYTNAGKSTLLNALTDAGVLVEDRLFATLDSTVRRLDLPNNRAVLFADTVGFVRRLPHHLVEAFQSTLAEVAEADLLLHVVDGSDEDPAGQIAAVRVVLEEIGAAGVPELIAFNKADLISDQAASRLANLYPDGVLISALKGAGLEQLLVRVGEVLERAMVTLTLEIPYSRGDLVAAAYRLGEVIEEKDDDNGMILEVRLPEAVRAQFAEFAR
jgi:GTP-binding protein HflX